MQPKVYIIILNYNGWADTIECLETILKLKYSNFQVLIVDNNSTNNSVEMIQKWAAGDFNLILDRSNTLNEFVYPLVKKPINYLLIDHSHNLNQKTINREEKVVLIRNYRNNGYAGGNNIGIKYALYKDDFKYLWIINNDVVLEPESLGHLVKKAQYYENIRKKVGIIGNKILHYYFPKTIQYAGGAKYYKWIGIASAIGGFKKDDGRYDVNEIAMDQVSGASMFVRKEFLNSVGLLCEDYFLFSEEIDWAERGRSKGWGLGYEWRAKVYHKVSASTGNHALPKKIKKSKFTDFYVIRSTLIFTRKFFPICLPTVYLGILGMLINRLRRGQINRVGMILKILINPSKDL